MRAGATASTGNIKIRGVGVGGEDHGAGLVEDYVVGVGGEERVDRLDQHVWKTC